MNGNKKPDRREYQKLLNRLYLRILAILLGTVAVVLGIRIVFRGQFANGITRVICLLGGMGWEEGKKLYHLYIGNNLEYILGFVIIVFFLILLRVAMMLFTRYFDQIVAGVDQLSHESDQPFVMSPELGFMAEKLTEVQTKLKKRTEEAQAAEQRKNDLVVYLAHDIKTPLTSVVGYLSLLEEAPDMPPEQRRRYVRVALEKAYRLESLIHEFFEITRYRFQSVPLNRSEVDLCLMLVQLGDELYPLLSEQGKELTLSVPEDLTVNGDSAKLARVCNNILKNAVAYSSPGSPILAEGFYAGDRVVLRFTNEGEIPADQLEHIFEKFYRLDASRSSATGGSGLGLAIARDIVRLHGGEVSARCEDGQTIFTVLLPR